MHCSGLRFRKHVRPLPKMRWSADAVFPTERVAVFLDGCFWHGCERHATSPRANSEFWREKIARNRARDATVDRALEDAGWIAVRVWEHEDPMVGAERVMAAVSRRRREMRAAL